MAVAVGIALVGVRLPETARDDAQSAVGDGGVVYRQPHGGPHEGIGDLEVGVVLMPVSAATRAARFESLEARDLRLESGGGCTLKRRDLALLNRQDRVSPASPQARKPGTERACIRQARGTVVGLPVRGCLANFIYTIVLHHRPSPVRPSKSYQMQPV